MRLIGSTRFVDAWAILSILWATLCVAAYAPTGECAQFGIVVCDVMTPIAALLILGGCAVRIIRGFCTSAA
jgi:hypothetical protein